MKKYRRFFILAVLFTGVPALAVVGFRFVGGYALDAYIAHLRAKGEKVTLPELAASLTPGAPDSAGVLSNLVLKLGPPPANPTNLQLMHFVASGRARVAWKQPVPPCASVNEGVATSWSELSQRVMQNEGPLAGLRLAMQHPAPNAGPWTNFFFQTRAHTTVIRAATFWLACAAVSALHDSHPNEALTNLQAIAGLANLYREDYTLQNAMVRVAVAGKGLDLTWEALQATNWDEQQLLALQKSWEAVDLLEGLERGLEGERIFGLESWHRWLSEQPVPAPGSSPSAMQVGLRFWRETVMANDLQFGMGYWQGKIELLRAVRANRPLKDIWAPWQSLDAQLDRRNCFPVRFFYLVSLVSTPNSKPALLTTTHVETERRLAVTAIALARYQHRHGRFPRSLDALVPEVLSSLPPDCMSGHPFGYQCNADGTFTLYSVGDDGKDNGGDPSPAASGGKLGLWDGRDAVWPLPVI